MHEQSFLAKLRRRILGVLAPVLPTSMMRLNGPEKAALALRGERQTPAETAAFTTFVIPLVGAHQVTDWGVIEATLSRCLHALISQDDGNWRAIVCSQTRPDAIDLDARIHYLPFTQEVKGHDKVPKLKRLIRFALHDDRKAGHLMMLDGDDLLHRAFTATAHEGGTQGLLVSSGAMLDAGTGHIGETAVRSLHQPLQKPFWKFCGSCMSLPIGRDWTAEQRFFDGLVEHEHRLYPYLATLAGFELRHSTTPLALYIINHGENFETRRGRGSFKQRFVQRFALQHDVAQVLVNSGFPQALDLLRVRSGGE